MVVGVFCAGVFLTPVFLYFSFPICSPSLLSGLGVYQLHPQVSFWICEPELEGQPV